MASTSHDPPRDGHRLAYEGVEGGPHLIDGVSAVEPRDEVRVVPLSPELFQALSAGIEFTHRDPPWGRTTRSRSHARLLSDSALAGD